MEEGINEFKLFDEMDVLNKNNRIYRYNDFLKFENDIVLVFDKSNPTYNGITLSMDGVVGKAKIKCKLGNVYALYEPINELGKVLTETHYLRTNCVVFKSLENVIVPASISCLFFTNDPA